LTHPRSTEPNTTAEIPNKGTLTTSDSTHADHHSQNAHGEDTSPGAVWDERNAIWLARQGWRVTGVDASWEGLAQAEARARDAGVSLELVNADVQTYSPPPGSFDLVVVANLHFPPGERADFFNHAAEALSPGGHLYVVGHHPASLGRAGPPFPERLYTEVRRHERPAADGGTPFVDAVAWATASTSEKATR